MCGFEPAAHHTLLLEHLERVERREIKRLIVCMPPGSAKSTYASQLFPAWYAGRNPEHSIIAASHTSQLAERFSRRVRNLILEPEFRATFDFSMSPDVTAVHSWEHAKGGEYFAVGVGGSVTGRRADLIVIDDPVRSREEADSETVRARVWEWWLADLKTRLKPNGAIVLILTRWHEDDLAGRLLKAAADGTGEPWHVLKLPMEAGEGDPLGRPPGERLWPDWFTDEMVADAKRDPRTWSALYQQEPRPAGGGEFRRDWLEFYDKPAENIRPGCNVYMLVDAANAKRTTSDYTAIWVIGLNTDGNYYVLDAVRDRMNLTERTAEVFRLHRRWKPVEVRYERYGLMADVDHIRYVQNQTNYRFAVKEVGGATPKNDRIRRLVPLFEQRKVWLPQVLVRTDRVGIPRDLVDAFVEQEYLAFPVSAHDDMLDALARIAEPDMPLVWPQQETDDRYERAAYRARNTRASAWAA